MIKAETLQIKPQFTSSGVTENTTLSGVGYLPVFFDQGKSCRFPGFHVSSKSGSRIGKELVRVEGLK